MADSQTPDNKDLNKINIEQYMRRGYINQSKKEDSEGEKQEILNLIADWRNAIINYNKGGLNPVLEYFRF